MAKDQERKEEELKEGIRSDKKKIEKEETALKADEEDLKEKEEELKKLEKEERKEHLIKVLVHYIAATKPFETEAEPTQTVGDIKKLALDAFGLVEGGGKVYNLFLGSRELQNLAETLGQLAEGKKEVKLDLEETFVQG